MIKKCLPSSGYLSTGIIKQLEVFLLCLNLVEESISLPVALQSSKIRIDIFRAI